VYGRWSVAIAVLALTVELIASLPSGGAAQQQVAAPPRVAAQQAAVAPVRLRVATWNICAEFAECPAVEDANGRVGSIAKLVDDHDLDAVLLQETCEWHVGRLLTRLGSGWSAAFSPWRQNDAEAGWSAGRIRTCAGGRSALGLAVVVKGEHDQPVTHTLPSPTVRYSFEAPMLCVRMKGRGVRLCNSHFTPATYDPSGTVRAAQRARVVEILRSFGDDKVVFGGDLNLLPPNGSFTPPSTALGGRHATLNPVYDMLRECDQEDGRVLTGAARAGETTTFWGDASAPTWGKLDYLFTTPSAADPAATFTSCDAVDGVAAYRRYSDHLPVVGVLQM
jgi:endonuclease/exonuclease/phosphatase family metal-dependent hydrolase